MVLVCKIKPLRGAWLTRAGIAILAHGLTLSPAPTSSHSTSRCLMNGTGASTLPAKKRRYATANSLRTSISSMRTCNSTLEFAPHIGVRSAIPGFSQTKRANLTPRDSSSVVWEFSIRLCYPQSQVCGTLRAPRSTHRAGHQIVALSQAKEWALSVQVQLVFRQSRRSRRLLVR